MPNPSFKVLIVISLFTTSLFSQNETQTNSQNFNELKINALLAPLGILEAGYERSLNNAVAIGVSGLVYTVEDRLVLSDSFSLNFSYYLSPYCRYYFGKKYASGIFIEVFTMLNAQTDKTEIYDEESLSFREERKDIIDLGLGAGLGCKWAYKSGYTIELFCGLGHNLFNDIIGLQAITKVGFYVGYKF